MHHEPRVGGSCAREPPQVRHLCETDHRLRRPSWLRDAGPVHAERHRSVWANWKLGPRAKGRRLTTLRAFFRFCVNRKWIAESPVSADIKPPVGSSKAANKAPFTDDELDRIIKVCDDVKVEWKNETGLGVWNGEDLKDLIWLMIYTGVPHLRCHVL